MEYTCTSCFEKQNSSEPVSRGKRLFQLTGAKARNCFLITKKTVQKYPFSFSVLVALVIATMALSIFSGFFPIPIALGIGAITLLNSLGTAYLSTKFFTHLRKVGDKFFCKSHTIEKMGKQREVCLVLQSTNDPKACYISSEIKKLEKEYDLIVERVSDIFQINRAVAELYEKNKKIACLWISAHGSPSHIFLEKGTYGKIDFYTAKYLKNFDKLSPEASIILDCCHAGFGNNNIAKELSLLTEGRRVVASKTSLAGNDIKVEKLTPLSFKAEVPTWGIDAKIPIRNIFGRIFCALLPLPLKKRLTKDVLVSYRNGILAV